MKPRILLFASTLVAVACSASSFAQTPGFYGMGGHSDNPNGPTVSPYMNLLQNNNQFNQVPNYQSLVKPLLDQQNAIQRQGAGLQRLQQQVSSGGSGAGGGGGRGTGHVTSFMNYSHFFPGHR
ncbi:MAG TPA: hypothetical protein VGZ26_10025 [Pirellulales bacterium]|jgi:hypothetical protein|nr:hypothetical protein [Pirellulales bacterium]